MKIIKVNTECDEDISENSLLSQLAIDSLTFIKIVIEIEGEFDIEFEDEKLQFSEFPTVRALVDYVKKRLEVI